MDELVYIRNVSYLLERTPQGRMVPPEAIQATEGIMLSRIGREIAESAEYQLQQKDFTPTLTSGVASLSAITDILLDTIETVKHPDIDGDGNAAYFSRIPDGTEQDLASALDSVNPPYIVDENAIKCSLGNGVWPTADDLPPNGILTVRANAVPTLATIHPRFEDRAVEIGAEEAVKYALKQVAA